MIDIYSLVRPNILNLKAYSSARHEFEGQADIYLDANENNIGGVDGKYFRYPDPLQKNLKEKISKLKNISVENIFLGNGSDEPIDLLMRVFCEPTKDKIAYFSPTYGMYKVAADINNVECVEMLLDDDFEINIEFLSDLDKSVKIIFLCSPNNPSGNLFCKDKVQYIIENFKGIVVVDEAYIDFSSEPSWILKIKDYENLVVLQTFSKAWGLAALRLGMAFANNKIIDLLNKVKYPYNINILTQETVIKILKKSVLIKQQTEIIKRQRLFLIEQLSKNKHVERVFPSEANFILVKFKEDAKKWYKKLLNNRVVVRDRSNQPLCENSLRITIGTPEENKKVINLLSN